MNTKELIDALTGLQERYGVKPVVVKSSDQQNSNNSAKAFLIYFDEDLKAIVIETKLR